MGLQNRESIRDYVESLPRIFPSKIRVRCGENHPSGCKVRAATKIAVPLGEAGKPDIHISSAYYWCDQCNIYSAGSFGRLKELRLDFPTVIELKISGAGTKNGISFHEILRDAYGIRTLDAQSAYDVFWK